MSLSEFRGRRSAPLAAGLALTVAWAPFASAFDVPGTVAKRQSITPYGVQAAELDVAPSLAIIEPRSLRAVAQPALQRFFDRAGDQWEVRWDERSDRPHLLQGSGLALLPGAGNALAPADAGLAEATEATLADVERLARGVLADHADLFRLPAGSKFVLDPTRSTQVSKGRVWFVELQQMYRGIPVVGANVFFRINNGNLVQFGTERVADVNLDTQVRVSLAKAQAAVLERLGIKAGQVSEMLRKGDLLIFPTDAASAGAGVAFQGARGQGYGHRLAWEFSFRRVGDDATYRARVDAHDGTLLELRDMNEYVTAQVTGGIFPTTNTDPEVVRALPFATVTNGTTKTTDANGNYDYSGGTATISLNGRYINMADNCGTISLSNSSTGALAFGTSGGTNCTTPGIGGAGNTHSARSGYYHLTNINRKAASFLTGNAWLNSTLTANMNINLSCNAFWNGSTVNFYRAGTSGSSTCSNTGEIAAVFLHEWGHGMDTNSGGAAANDNGTGEAVGDTFAFIETKDSCIGANFRPGVVCSNCTTCTGVRDVGVFAQGGARTIARPSTVTDNAGINCDAILGLNGVACPYSRPDTGTAYRGPMGYEGHCESYIASSANWDLAQSLVATYGTTAGWAAMDQIWYESLTPSKSAYQVAAGGQCNTAATVNGCGATNWYTVYLSVDDDDGNLANGTPNGCRIWDAFNAHGIACGTRPACSSTCVPQAIADAGPDQNITAGQSVTIGTPARSGHTYSWTPGGATTAQITVSPTVTTTYTVTASTSCGSTTDSVTVTVGTTGTELLTNGGFETSSSPWVLSGTGASYTANGTGAHGGTGYVSLGLGNNRTGQVYQQIAIPSGSAVPNLTFWLSVTSAETTTTTQFDKLFVEVRNTAGTLLATLATYSNLNKGAYAQRGPFDLSAYKGQTVRVQFRSTMDSSLVTTFNVDDASVK